VGARDEVRRLRQVAEEAGHGDAAVLDLGVAEVADGALGAEAPEVEVQGAKRIPEADDGVELLGQVREVVLRLLDLDRRARLRGRDEGSGRSEESEREDGGFHGLFGFFA